MDKLYIQRVSPQVDGGCLLMRRSVATMLLEKGCPVEIIQIFLGHKYLRTTQLYTKIRVSHLKAIYQQCHPAIQGGAHEVHPSSRNPD